MGMQTSMDGLVHDGSTEQDGRVGSGLVTWILAAITLELVVAIFAAVAWVTRL